MFRLRGGVGCWVKGEETKWEKLNNSKTVERSVIDHWIFRVRNWVFKKANYERLKGREMKSLADCQQRGLERCCFSPWKNLKDMKGFGLRPHGGNG